MKPFTTLASVAAVMPEANVDTDIIYPARFLLITAKEGLGQYAFFEKRFLPTGERRAEFVLNHPDVRDAQILVAGENFGCGSSREQAAWALLDLGIRCIIAPSFGEIFSTNCFKNGILPITVSQHQWNTLSVAASQGSLLNVDLSTQSIRIDTTADAITFPISSWRLEALLNGWDEIDMILKKDAAKIGAFESLQRSTMPWLYA